ncbi:MAG: DNA replication/repair protein RecF, partial [Pseudonocardiaceae bacterium]
LCDYRNYEVADVNLSPGLTVITGNNGGGKTNLLEAMGYLSTLASFRGAPNEALVRAGSQRAVLRGSGERSGRSVLVEAEITSAGRSRATLNRQSVRRSSDLLEAVLVTVFSPDDLELVKGAPAIRRRYLDDVLASLHPRHDATRRELERILKQRTALLRQIAASGVGQTRLGRDEAGTLAVWDTKLVEVGEVVGQARADLVDQLRPLATMFYRRLATIPGSDSAEKEGGPAMPEKMHLNLSYEAPWRASGLVAALVSVRHEEIRRGSCLVGPHRDDLGVTLDGLPGRTHASQGEQRCVALAMRLAAHQLVTDRLGEAPLLLLDDVFSELDANRSRALVGCLPP